jgi:hypothetical protein
MNFILILNYLLKIIFQKRNTSNIRKNIKNLNKIKNTRKVIIKIVNIYKKSTIIKNILI